VNTAVNLAQVYIKYFQKIITNILKYKISDL